jgi:hypothetical protein
MARRTPLERLRARFEAMGYTVHKIRIPMGWYRTARDADVVRWKADVTLPGGEGERRWITSWDTVTTCARFGIEVAGIGPSGYVEAHAVRRG